MNSSKLTSFATMAAAAIFSATLATPPAQAQVSVGIHIGTPPPPLRYENRPPSPGAGLAWTDGFYEPYRNAYRWHPGYWQRPPYDGAYYVHPHWDRYPDGYHMHEGYWARGAAGENVDRDSHYWDNHPHGRNDNQRQDDRGKHGDHGNNGNHGNDDKHDKHEKHDKHDDND